MADRNTPQNWNDEDKYWQGRYHTRPYANRSSDYEVYRPGYRYGYEAANRYQGRDWNDVESELSSGWDTCEYRGTSTWEHVKGAVRDAWDRVMGHQPVVTK